MHFKPRDRVSGRWVLGESVGESEDYEIFTATDSEAREVLLQIAKVEESEYACYTLAKECHKLFEIFQHGNYDMKLSSDEIPLLRPIWLLSHRRRNVLSLHPLGKSLQTAIDENRLKYRTAYTVAREMVHALEIIHRSGYIHMDINPKHMFLCTGFDQGNFRVCLGGFRYCIRFTNTSTTSFLEEIKTNYRPGHWLFSSANVMKNMTCGPRDDLESLGYCLIYMLRGNLPWSEMDEVEAKDYIRELKSIDRRTELCQGLGIIRAYFEIVDQIQWTTMPSYETLKELFRKGIEALRNGDGGITDLRAPMTSIEGFMGTRW